MCSKMCGKMYGTIEKLLYQNKIWCGTRYGPHDYDSGDKKTKTQKHKKAIRQKDKKTKRQKDKRQKKSKRQKGKNGKNARRRKNVKR